MVPNKTIYYLSNDIHELSTIERHFQMKKKYFFNYNHLKLRFYLKNIKMNTLPKIYSEITILVDFSPYLYAVVEEPFPTK